MGWGADRLRVRGVRGVRGLGDCGVRSIRAPSIPMNSSCRLHLWSQIRQRHRCVQQSPETTVCRPCWSVGGLSLSGAKSDDMSTQQDVAQGDEDISTADVQTSGSTTRPSSYQNRISLACDSCRSRKTKVGCNDRINTQSTFALLNGYHPSVMDSSPLVRHVNRYKYHVYTEVPGAGRGAILQGS